MPNNRFRYEFFIILVLAYLPFAPGGAFSEDLSRSRDRVASSSAENATKKKLVEKYSERRPSRRGKTITGVRRRLATKDRVVAITLDACPRRKGIPSFDDRILELLDKEKIPATIFVSGRWIDANLTLFKSLAADPLIETANHGLWHRPAVVDGSTVYGIRGPRSVAELVDEVAGNQTKIAEVTGREPIYFRSGTAVYDDIAAKLIEDLGLTSIGSTIEADEGATLPRERIAAKIGAAKEGSIILLHFNHPGGTIADGLAAGIAELKRRGFRFVRLGEYPLE